MKTLVVTDVFPPQVGGSGRWLWEIYSRLPRQSFFIAAGQASGQEEFDRTHDLLLVRMPLHFSTWGISSLAGLRQYTRTAWRLRRLIRSENIGMLHCGKCLPEGFLAWLLKRWCGLPYICYIHGEELTLAATSRELGWLTRHTLHGAKFVIANSRNTEALLRKAWNLPADRVRVLHPGVDTQRFRPAPRDSTWRARLGWGDRPVILTVGRLQKRKGHDHLILALKAVRRQISDVLYAIVGDGEERGELEVSVRREGLAGHVQFLGGLNDDDLVSCYQQCDLFVLPNRQVRQDIEGFGMVLLEAQACGKPVIAGISGGTAETMCIPETGQTVSCDDPDELAALLIEWLSNKERLDRMGHAARRWAVARFDWETLTRQAGKLFAGTAPLAIPQRETAGAEATWIDAAVSREATL
jgi:phosphatidylinositol alpha-1,6-mannosyltransferase